MPLTLDDKTAADLTELAREQGFDSAEEFLHHLIDTRPKADPSGHAPADTDATPPEVLAEVRRRQADGRSKSIPIDEAAERFRQRFHPELSSEQWAAMIREEREALVPLQRPKVKAAGAAGA